MRHRTRMKSRVLWRFTQRRKVYGAITSNANIWMSRVREFDSLRGIGSPSSVCQGSWNQSHRSWNQLLIRRCQNTSQMNYRGSRTSISRSSTRSWRVTGSRKSRIRRNRRTTWKSVGFTCVTDMRHYDRIIETLRLQRAESVISSAVKDMEQSSRIQEHDDQIESVDRQELQHVVKICFKSERIRRDVEGFPNIDWLDKRQENDQKLGVASGDIRFGNYPLRRCSKVQRRTLWSRNSPWDWTVCHRIRCWVPTRCNCKWLSTHSSKSLTKRRSVRSDTRI